MKTTVTTLQNMKAENKKLQCLHVTIIQQQSLWTKTGVDTILVGDSLGNTMLGYEDTISVTVEDMIHHCAAVARGKEPVNRLRYAIYVISVISI